MDADEAADSTILAPRVPLWFLLNLGGRIYEDTSVSESIPYNLFQVTISPPCGSFYSELRRTRRPLGYGLLKYTGYSEVSLTGPTREPHILIYKYL